MTASDTDCSGSRRVTCKASERRDCDRTFVMFDRISAPIGAMAGRDLKGEQEGERRTMFFRFLYY